VRSYSILEHNRPLMPVESEIPELTGTQVLVKISHAGVCHTDLHLWEGAYNLGGGKKLQMSERGLFPPITPGHEISGEIVSVGPDADASIVGRKCVVHPWLGCGECGICERGQENLCLKPNFLGVQHPGGFSEYVVAPDPKFCVDIGDLDPAQSALMACSGVTTYSAIRKFGGILKDEPLVILGAGGLGFMALSILKALGLKGAIMVDLDDKKLKAAMKEGALSTVNSNDEDAAQQIINATGGGAVAVLDLVGAEPTINLAIASVARGARIVVCGLYGGELVVPLPYIPMRPLHIQGSWVGNLRELKELVKLAREHGVSHVPVRERPLSEADTVMNELKDGAYVGRTVLVP
jgi:D-arabinose 1-dehydrogenase-like Zn-dependent alcohol dehydrogenase